MESLHFGWVAYFLRTEPKEGEWFGEETGVPVVFEPVDLIETGNQGAGDGAKEEAYG
jgi:hypothetical protein